MEKNSILRMLVVPKLIYRFLTESLQFFMELERLVSQIYIEEQKAKESSDIPEEQEARSSFSMRYQNAE